MSLLGADTVTALAETFNALGDGTRVRMLDALSRTELCVCDLAKLLDLTESAVSHQLRLLRGLRLVKSRREGRHIYYALDDHHIVKLFQQGLAHVEEREGGPERAALRSAESSGVERSPLRAEKAAAREYVEAAERPERGRRKRPAAPRSGQPRQQGETR